MDWNSPTIAAIFGEDFDHPTPPAPPPETLPPEPVYTAADLRAARDEGLRDGHAAGMAEAEGTAAALARHALLTVAERLDTARTEAATIAEEAADALGRLTMEAFAAAFPALCARHAETEMRGIVRAILPRLRQEPAIVVRTNPILADALAAEIAAIDPDLPDRVRIAPLDGMPLGDVRIVWRAGNARRDAAGLWADIENILTPASLLGHATGETEHGQ